LRRALARRDLVRAVGDEFPAEIPLHRVGAWRQRIGASALPRLRSAIVVNAERGRARASDLRRLPGITVIDELSHTKGTWPFLMVLADRSEVRDRILQRLWSEGLGVNRLFIYDLTGYKHLDAVVPAAEVRHARSFAERSFSVSNSEYLSEEQFGRIRDVIAHETIGS